MGAGAGKRLVLPILLAVLLIGLAIWKPWSQVADGPGASFALPSQLAIAPSPSPTASPRPTPAPTPDPDAVPCISSDGWRVVARERTAGRETQTWIAVDPEAAGGPLDESVPEVRVVAGTLRGLGYCLPDRIQQRSRISEAWSVEADARGTNEIAQRIELRRLTAPLIGWADLYDPPKDLHDWPPGSYVFAVTVGIRQPVWFRVVVVKAASDETDGEAEAAD